MLAPRIVEFRPAISFVQRNTAGTQFYAPGNSDLLTPLD